MKIEIDKYYHFGVGVVIAVIMLILTESILASLFVVTFGAYAKEYYDTDTTGFSIADIIATILGGFLAILIYTII